MAPAQPSARFRGSVAYDSEDARIISPRPTALVHLVRHANGLEPFVRFMDSYDRHPAGLDHELVLLFKGFPVDVATAPYTQRVTDRELRAIHVSDEELDLSAYVAAAASIESRWILHEPAGAQSRGALVHWLWTLGTTAVHFPRMAPSPRCIRHQRLPRRSRHVSLTMYRAAPLEARAPLPRKGRASMTAQLRRLGVRRRPEMTIPSTFLDVVLPSLAAQTFADMHTVVADNGSTDGTAAWLGRAMAGRGAHRASAQRWSYRWAEPLPAGGRGQRVHLAAKQRRRARAGCRGRARRSFASPRCGRIGWPQADRLPRAGV